MILSRGMLRKTVLFAAVLLCFFIQTVQSQPSLSAVPSTAADFYAAGKQYQNSLKWHNAVEMFQESLRLNPSYADSWFGLAQCTYSLGEYQLALSYIDSASKFVKNNASYDNLRGLCLIGLEKTAEARAVFLAVLAGFPNDVDARYGLAMLDILEGKISAAEKQYSDALKRQTGSRKALLSLAVLSSAQGKRDAAEKYISDALKYHADSSEVFYYASIISFENGLMFEAEGRVRAALRLDPNNLQARQLLASILFAQKRYQEAADVCDEQIRSDRSASTAWYLKAVSLRALGKNDEAAAAFSTGLKINPSDEIMRYAFESLILDTYAVENKEREIWAAYHAEAAFDAEKKFLSAESRYEYQRALRLNPLGSAVRKAYAELLLRDGFTESYLSQLKFLQQRGESDKALHDAVESYSSLLRNSLSNKWKIDPFYLDKTRIRIGLYAVTPNVLSASHPDADLVSVRTLSEFFAAKPYFAVHSPQKRIVSYADAFSQSRTSGHDYFGLFSIEENDRDVRVSVTLYSARTGSEAGFFSAYRTGNGKFSSALRQITEDISSAFPARGKIIARSGTFVLIDTGRREQTVKDTVFTVIKKDMVNTADSGIDITFNQDAVLGTVKITAVNEEISQGDLTSAGFYDRINVGDEIAVQKTEKQETDVKKNTGSETVKNSSAQNLRISSISALIRSIR